MWDYFVLSPMDDSFFIFRYLCFNTWKYLCLRQKSAVLRRSMNTSLVCDHGANRAWGWNESAPMHTSRGQSAAVLPQLSTGFLWNYSIVRDNEKSLQHCHSFQLPAGMAWGWSELPSWGRQSLLAPQPAGALVSSQLLQGSRALAASPAGAQCLTDVLEATVSS